jgi:hypothetical protein
MYRARQCLAHHRPKMVHLFSFQSCSGVLKPYFSSMLHGSGTHALL